MLILHDVERQLLLASGALGQDESGAEILVGLTVLETEYVLKADQSGTELMSTEQREKYLALVIKHRCARISLATEQIKADSLYCRCPEPSPATSYTLPETKKKFNHSC